MRVCACVRVWVCSADVAAVAHRLDIVAYDAQQRAPAAEIVALRSSLQVATERLQTVEATAGSLQAQVAATARATHVHAQEVVDAARSDLAARISALDAALANLTQEVDARAYMSSLESTDDRVRSVSSTVAHMCASLDVATRFVAWFSERGEAYEYNAGALERHMNALAVGNRARVVPSLRDLLATHGSDVAAPHTHAPPHTHAQPHADTRERPDEVVTGSTRVRIGGLDVPEHRAQ